MFLPAVRIYPITDVRLSGLSHAEQVVRLSEGGATLIQLREKNLAPHGVLRQAEAALRVARQRGVRIIINDRVDIALALKADGVHLRPGGLPPRGRPIASSGLRHHRLFHSQRRTGPACSYPSS